jgi:hypothetical protein
MKVFIGLLLAGMAFAGSSNAALPPLWQGTAEIKAILEDQQLSNVLPSGDVLVKIVKIPKGYLLITNKRKVFVHVKYEESQMPGPAKFKVEFGEVKLKKHEHDDEDDHH